MKLFISWSGTQSKEIAEIFRTWIPGVIQAAKPYYSPNDIEKGTRWSNEIAKELEASKFGIICLTKDNLEAPWIMFEAGALSKNIERSKLCPFLFGVEPADVQGPLVQFQAAKFEKAEVKKLMKSINAELSEQSLASEVFETVFEMWWPKLDESIAACLKKHIPAKAKHGAIRTEKDMLEEILALTRSISQRNELPKHFFGKSRSGAALAGSGYERMQRVEQEMQNIYAQRRAYEAQRDVLLEDLGKINPEDISDASIAKSEMLKHKLCTADAMLIQLETMLKECKLKEKHFSDLNDYSRPL